MADQNATPHDCPPSLKMLGDYWTLYIINVLRDGEVRFSELRRGLGNANPVTLTNRLKKLEASNIIKRSIETMDKQSVSYSLTPLGTEALPIIDAYYRFAKISEATK